MVTNRVFLCAIVINFNCTIDTITISCPSASGNANFCIYFDNGDTPKGGAKVPNSDTGSLAVANHTSFTFSPAVSLNKGQYWLAVIFDNAVGTFTRAVAVGELAATSAASPMDGCRFDAGGFSLPDPCPAVTNDNNVSPNIWIRVSAVYS